MREVAIAAALCLSLFAFASAEGSKGSAVQKVIELLDELKGKVQADLDAESKAFSEYSTFCDDTVAEKTNAIKVAARQIEDLQATIEDSEATIGTLTNEISDLGNVISDKNQELHGATAHREEANAVFVQGEAELVKSVDMIARGTEALKEGQSFAQGRMGNKHWAKIVNVLSSIVSAMRLDLTSSSKLQSFVQAAKKKAEAADDDDDLELPNFGSPVNDAYEKSLPQPVSLIQQPNPEAPAFESQGGAILETMESMEDKAEKTLGELRKKEMAAQMEYDLLKDGLETELTHSQDKLATAQQNKALAIQAKEDATAKLAETEKSKKADEDFTRVQKEECKTKAREWEERSGSGAGELAALGKAREILSDGVTAFTQVGTSRVSRHHGQQLSQALRERLADFLKSLSKQHSSFALMQLATVAMSDPFVKIRGLIETMIEKLQKEANEEATHEAFCQEELGKSRKQKEDKGGAADKHKARMDTAATSIAELMQAIANLNSEVADIDKAQGEATSLRQKENEEYKQASSDFRGSAEAVARAIEVLKNYYEGQSLLEVRSKSRRTSAMQPQFGAARSDAGGTIISVLDMAQEDFTSLLAESEAAEEEAKAAYEKLTQENKLAKMTKEVEVKSKESEVKGLKVALEHSTEDYDSVSKELDAVNLYLAKLEPECTSKGMSYAERKAAREAELEGLKEALNILSGDAIALVQTGRRLRAVRHA